MATNETKIPSIPPIPSDVDPKLKTYLNAVDEALKVRLGRTGDPKDRAVTVRELIDTGLAENFKENPFDPNAGTPPNTFIPTERVDVTIPPDVTGFSGVGAFQKIILSWDLAQFGNFAFTEVWRHTSNDIGSAIRIDTTRAQVYADTVDLDANFYYWVRHVSTSNVVGQFTSGINVTTSKVSSSNVTDFFVADSITAASGVIADATIGTAEIANLAVTGAKIQNAAITNAKINDLSATKITAGTLDVAGKAVSATTGFVGTTTLQLTNPATQPGYLYSTSTNTNIWFQTFGAASPYHRDSSGVHFGQTITDGSGLTYSLPALLRPIVQFTFRPDNSGTYSFIFGFEFFGVAGNHRTAASVTSFSSNSSFYDTSITNTNQNSSDFVAGVNADFLHTRARSFSLTAGVYYVFNTFAFMHDIFKFSTTSPSVRAFVSSTNFRKA
jgi:hypothetical protein